jgi:hypothetical protein
LSCVYCLHQSRDEQLRLHQAPPPEQEE